MKKLLSLIFGLGLILSSAMTATAATSENAVITVNAIPQAALAVSITGVTFPAVTYSFAPTATTGNFTIRAVDNRGTGQGWNISISAAPFKNANNTRGFAASQLSLAAGTVAVNAGNPATAGQGKFAVADMSTGGKIWNATIGSGDGDYTLTSLGTLTVPGGTLVDTYTSVVTVSITTGP